MGIYAYTALVAFASARNTSDIPKKLVLLPNSYSLNVFITRNTNLDKLAKLLEKKILKIKFRKNLKFFLFSQIIKKEKILNFFFEKRKKFLSLYFLILFPKSISINIIIINIILEKCKNILLRENRKNFFP